MTGFVVVIASSCVQNSWDFTRVSLVQVCLWEETLQPLWALSFARICTRPVFSQEYKDHKWICAHPAGNCDPWWGTERHTGPSAARAQNYMSLHIAPETAFSGWPSESLRGLYSLFGGCKHLVTDTTSSCIPGKCFTSSLCHHNVIFKNTLSYCTASVTT